MDAQRGQGVRQVALDAVAQQGAEGRDTDRAAEERKNETSELPAPRSSARTWFCTARTRFCWLMPMPTPTKNMNIATSQ
ncbi:hypothetical protein GCM10027612_16380 [Microbispora bryophytorum subsp. camponoti]